MLHKVNENMDFPLSNNDFILKLKKGQIRHDLESLLSPTELVKIIAEGKVSEYVVTVPDKTVEVVLEKNNKNKKGK